MFSFSFKNERYIQPHTYVEEKQEEEEQDQMEEDPSENQRVFEQFVFPQSRAEECLIFAAAPSDGLFFKKELVPKTLIPLAPNILNGLESIDDLTAGQKSTLSVYMCLPMPVPASPLLTLISDNVPRGAQQAHKHRHVSAVQSVFKLRSLALLVYQRAVPFHSSVTNEYPQECYDDFLEQINSYEALQETRVRQLTEEHPPDYINVFISYLEDFTWYYINSLEHYLFKTLIEPHGSSLLLEHLLTPRVGINLSDCHPATVQSVRKLVVDFFTLKVAATHKHEQRHAGPDYVQMNPFNLAQIEARITSLPPQQLYRGYIDKETMEEYYEFSK
jgi:hypothetical protein